MKLLLLILLFPCLVFSRTIKVAVIDTGLDNLKGVKLCPKGLIDLTDTSMRSEADGHGNNVSHIIVDGLEKEDYCLYHIKAVSPLKNNYNLALAMAIYHKVDIINYSAGGPTSDVWEEALVTLAIKNGIKLITAVGNHSQDLDKNCNFFPACYVKNTPGLITVANNHKSSNYGKKTVTFTRNGVNVAAGGTTLSGSSQATAMVSREILIKLLKENKK